MTIENLISIANVYGPTVNFALAEEEYEAITSERDISFFIDDASMVEIAEVFAQVGLGITAAATNFIFNYSYQDLEIAKQLSEWLSQRIPDDVETVDVIGCQRLLRFHLREIDMEFMLK